MHRILHHLSTLNSTCGVLTKYADSRRWRSTAINGFSVRLAVSASLPHIFSNNAQASTDKMLITSYSHWIHIVTELLIVIRGAAMSRLLQNISIRHSSEG